MKKTIGYINMTLIVLLANAMMYAQTADVQAGCSPLEVNFNAPVQAKYYWDFNDGAVSIDQNPKHVFTKAGNYTVTLYQSQGGAKVGTLTIKVYADPVIEIKSTPKSGCSPLIVNFEPTIKADTAIKINSYKWSFGDGNSSTERNPSYTYKEAGEYNVSLEINTSFGNCNVTQVFLKEIKVESVTAAFDIVANDLCTVPSIVEFKNTSTFASSSNYKWDFGNGTTSSIYNPAKVTYNKEGVYVIKCIAVNQAGCADTLVKSIKIGLPAIGEIAYTDTICKDASVRFSTEFIAKKYEWKFEGGNISASNSGTPTVKYTKAGLFKIQLTFFASETCKTDTTFYILVDAPDASFTVNPKFSCEKVMDVKMNALNKNNKYYFWNGSTDEGSDSYSFQIGKAKRDSFYMNYRDTFFLSLKIVSKAGCIATKNDTIIHNAPDAYIISSNVRGCAPHTVSFSDISYTHVPVTKRKWLFSDGTIVNDLETVTKTYNAPGEYFVKLIIENEAGCTDTSTAVKIYVGEKIKPSFEIDKTEICLGDSIKVKFLNTDPRIQDYHLTTDGGLYNHCYSDKTAVHKFVHSPGIYDVTGSVVYNGCVTDSLYTKKIVVKGAKSKIGYMINCATPYDVMFKSKSIGATSLKWKIVNFTSTQDSFVHRFDSRGDFKVVLEANDGSTCPTGMDSVDVHIREIKAKFSGDSIVCDNNSYIFDAGLSQDVDNDCSKGYFWKFSHHRPLETSNAVHKDSFPSGNHFMTLIVEDENGCKDTVSRNIKSYGITPKFTISDEVICLPDTLLFTSLSTADTLIKKYTWSFDSTNVKQLTKIFVPSNFKPKIILQVEDALGCKDTISKIIKLYAPFSFVTIKPALNVCVGAELSFMATDYTAQGSFLKFDWDFGPYGKSNNMANNILFDKKGQYPVKLKYTEASTGCSGEYANTITVYNPPKAAFSSDVDNLPEICHPKIIDFINESVIDGPVTYKWMIGNLANSTKKDPTESLIKGTHTVWLKVISPYGCSDSISRTYKLVGPEGDFTVNKDSLCKGESAIFTLINPSDVSKYTWDFGDGQLANNTSPVTHQFNVQPDSGYITINLIMKSDSNNCESKVEKQLKFKNIQALFEILEFDKCKNEVVLKNNSIGGQRFVWDFGDGKTSSEVVSNHTYETTGDFVIKLVTFANNDVCRDTFAQNLKIDPTSSSEVIFPNIFTPNGDSNNDFFNVSYDKDKVDSVQVIAFKIYDRWGQLVYDNDVPLSGWDGDYNDEPSPAEVYAYYIEILVNECIKVAKKGNVTLMR